VDECGCHQRRHRPGAAAPRRRWTRAEQRAPSGQAPAGREPALPCADHGGDVRSKCALAGERCGGSSTSYAHPGTAAEHMSRAGPAWASGPCEIGHDHDAVPARSGRRLIEVKPRRSSRLSSAERRHLITPTRMPTFMPTATSDCRCAWSPRRITVASPDLRRRSAVEHPRALQGSGPEIRQVVGSNPTRPTHSRW